MRYVYTTACRCIIVAAAFTAVPLLAQQPATQSGGNGVHAVTYIDISTDWIVQGVGLLKQYRDQSRKEGGNLEFLVLQETDQPNRLAFVEGWRDDAAFQAHAKGANASLFEFTLEAIRNSPPDRHMLQTFATAPARGQAAGGALYMLEHIDFMGGDPAVAQAAQPVVKTLAAASQQEPGAVRFDIYQQPPPRGNHYEVVAVWNDMKGVDAHETAAHTRQFRAMTTMPGSPGRANLNDQRLYKVVN